jgi:hypothetical protein
MRACAGIGFFLCVIGPIALADADPPKASEETSLDADKLPPGLFTGTIVSTPNDDRMLTINVAYQKVQLKPGQNLARTNQNLQRQYNRILQLQMELTQPPRRGHNSMSTLHQLQSARVHFQTQLARAEANMFEIVRATHKVDFQIEESVKVRIKDPPEPFDDKGNIKKYSREELAALKGKDKDLPGYESSLADLKAGQFVLVKLIAHQTHRPAPAPAAAEGKDKAAEAHKDKEASIEHKHQLHWIVILKDVDSLSSSTKSEKRKKNK